MGKKRPAKYPLSECGEPRKAGFTPEHWWQVNAAPGVAKKSGKKKRDQSGARCHLCGHGAASKLLLQSRTCVCVQERGVKTYVHLDCLLRHAPATLASGECVKCSRACACLAVKLSTTTTLLCAASKRKGKEAAPTALRALRTTPPRDAAAAAAAAAPPASPAPPPPPAPAAPPPRAPPALTLPPVSLSDWGATPAAGREDGSSRFFPRATPWQSPPCLEDKENAPPRTAGGRLAASCGGWSAEAGEEEGVLPNSCPAHCPSPIQFGGRFGSGGRLSDAARGLGLLFEKQRRPS